MRERWVWAGVVIAVLSTACAGTSPLSDSLRTEDSGTPAPAAGASGAPPSAAGTNASGPAQVPPPLGGRASGAGSGSSTGGAASAAGSGSSTGGAASAAGSGGTAAAGDDCPAGFTAPPVCEPCPNGSCARPACRHGSFSHWKCADAPSGCVVGGCSAQLCSDAKDAPLISTCEFRDEYACYRTARCERQPSGACGWSPTPELQQCLANPGRADAGL